MSQMNPNNTMKQHVNKLGALVEELDDIGATTPNEIKVMVLLMSLLESYQYLITTFEMLKEEDCTQDDVNTMLLNEKLMQKEKCDYSQTMEVALLAQKYLKSENNTTNKSKDTCNHYKRLNIGLKIARIKGQMHCVNK